MKRTMMMTAAAAFLFCADGVQAQNGAPKKVLTAYYSHSGNTRTVARQIQQLAGGDLFEIEPVEAYPEEYRAVVEQAKKEIAAGFRPALRGLPQDVAQYDVIFIGSPCWWATIAPPVAAFLASCDLAGKTVVSFMTHEGSGMGRSEADIRKLCPASTVTGGLPVRGSAVDRSQGAVKKWLEGMNLAQ